MLSADVEQNCLPLAELARLSWYNDAHSRYCENAYSLCSFAHLLAAVLDDLFNGRLFWALTVVDNFNRECLGPYVGTLLRGRLWLEGLY